MDAGAPREIPGTTNATIKTEGGTMTENGDTIMAMMNRAALGTITAESLIIRVKIVGCLQIAQDMLGIPHMLVAPMGTMIANRGVGNGGMRDMLVETVASVWLTSR
jgi:hypothetical protein